MELQNRDALIADVSSRIIAGVRDQLADYLLALVAERTAKGIIRSGTLHDVCTLSFHSSFETAISGSFEQPARVMPQDYLSYAAWCLGS